MIILIILKLSLVVTVSSVIVVKGFPAKDSEATTFVLDDVGCLVTRDNSGISGKVHVVKNSNQLWISQFNFTKEHKDAHFNIGKDLNINYINRID